MPQSKISANFSHYLFYFLVFNACFLFWQFLIVYSTEASFVGAIPLPFSVYLEILATLSLHLCLYFVLSCIQTILLQGVLKRTWRYFSPLQWQLIIWTSSILLLLCLNLYYFPLSIFSKLLAPLIPNPLLPILLSVTLILCLLLVLNSRILLTTTVLLFILALFWGSQSPEIRTASTSHKPNIIILGIDSLSPEQVTKQAMPFVYNRLENSMQFTHTLSPLARTFPAWCSILTGLYAKHHHCEENLVAKQGLKTEASIVWSLNQQGYTTLFASDDRRFNALDKTFGFQHLLGPKLGVNDTILGSFNDFPLSNLLINLPIGAWLFPYNHMNRASFFSYYPQTFDKALQKKLKTLPNSPVFLAVHFTLPHWPYAWAESSPEQVNNEFSLEKREALYQAALSRVDLQFKTFYNFLKQEGFLDNSLLIILSDHGEVLYHSNSRLTNYSNYQGIAPSPFALYLENKTATVLDKSAGHGSDLLSPGQYSSLLAFTRFIHGHPISAKTKIHRRIALIDIAPTLLDFMHLPLIRSDGVSLQATLINPKKLPAKRVFYLESGMFPNQAFSKQKALKIGRVFYNINPNSKELEIKPEKLATINRQKLYGIIDGSWILVVYPQSKHADIQVIQNLYSGKWTDHLDSEFAKSSPAAGMLRELSRSLDNDFG